ncbi:MAG: Gfo/Idh/MocA family oxidoreductase [Planctomycetes bacterium]|nr:Gfo/Idh/MocA family oxidoreductase [Planctomycetota bacterium]
MSSSKTWRVGLIGCGGMGRYHLKMLQAMPDFKIVAVCDLLPAAAEKAGQEFNVPATFGDFEKMLDSVSMDMVTVATQTRGHHAPTVAAARRGISVLCEKPIAIDPAEADEMVETAHRSGAKLAIHQQNHVNPGIRKAQAMVAQGVIGDVVLVRGRNKAGRRSGNEFMEMGTHVTDMMLCFGGAPAWVAGHVTIDGRLAAPRDIMEAKEMSPRDRDSGLVMGQRALAHYGFERGVLGEIHFLAYSKTMSENYGVDILGSQGQLAVRAGGSVGPGSNLWHLARPMEGTPAQLADWKQVDLAGIGVEEPMVTMYRRLVESIGSANEPPSSGVEGRQALEMILGIYESHRNQGQRIPLPLSQRQHPLACWRQASP